MTDNLVLSLLKPKANYEGWWEAVIANQVIARSPVYRYKQGTYAGDVDSAGAKASRDAKQELINQLSADGWEPVIDPRSGEVTAMKRVTTG